MQEYKFGANILENLTTGMYQDSKVIFREYIQNSCDQIDKAIRMGILDDNEGKIEIWLDNKTRSISIEDNATGVEASEFERVLGNIADSDKKIGENKGFRGIGRLCGLAYCDTLIFTSSVKGESVESKMICDAKLMRKMLNNNSHGNKVSASDILKSINTFEQKRIDNIESHYFKVELININIENTDLLDNQQVKDYLSFVAPVPYQNSFIYRSEIEQFVKANDLHIDQYIIKLEGEQILKRYTTILKDSSGKKYDEIYKVEFEKFFDDKNRLIAWMWLGISKFSKAIPKNNQMRGLRLRKDNIQIGREDALLKLFKQERGNNYFVGEVFALSSSLIPNSQRDYFNENAERVIFEKKLRKYFNEELHRLYYDGSTINSAYKLIDSNEKLIKDINNRINDEDFINNEHRHDELRKVEEYKAEAEAKKRKIENLKNKSNGLISVVIERIEKERDITPNIEYTIKKTVEKKNQNKKDKLASYNRNERKLINKIFAIIYKNTSIETATQIIRTIEDELQ